MRRSLILPAIASGFVLTIAAWALAEDGFKVVVVKKGETLPKIAERELGDAAAWTKISREDGVSFDEASSKLVKPGDKVRVPSKPAGTSTAGPAARKLAKPPATWREHWFEHVQLLKLADYTDDAAIYFDKDMPHEAIWLTPFVSKAWRYTKKTYGEFGPDPRLYAIFHAKKYGGGHPSGYFDDSHDRKNVSDCGLDSWGSTSIDYVSHEVGHVVEGTNNGIHESPGFEVWKDSKWIEFYQYDLYVALGMHADARRLFDKFSNQVDDFPRPGTHWFRDFFYPLWRDHGHGQVMANFFGLLAKHFPKEPVDNGRYQRYTRRMNWGEFIHFMSGAAGKDVKPLAEKAFGWPDEWTDQLKKARLDFPAIEYKP